MSRLRKARPGANLNFTPRQENDEKLYNFTNETGINSVFEFGSQVNMYYEMKIPSEMMKPLEELTLMAWVYPTKHGDVRIFDSSVAGENYGGFGFDLYMDKIRFLGSQRSDNLVQVNCASSKRNVRFNQWNHCCVTFNRGEMKFYMDGELDLVHTSQLKALDPPIFNKLCIGYSMRGHPGSGYYKGCMSQLSVWSAALSDKQVETCSRRNLLLLKGDSKIADNQYFVDSELYHIFKSKALIYLPYLSWKKNEDRLRNFGVSNENLDIKVYCDYVYNKKSLSTSNAKAKFSSESGFDLKQYPVLKGVYWIQEMHQHFSHQKKDLINLLLLIANRHQSNSALLGELPSEVLEVVFSFLE